MADENLRDETPLEGVEVSILRSASSLHESQNSFFSEEDESALREQAAQLELLLPRLARRLFSMERDHAAEELPLAQLRVCSILLAGSRTLSAISEELGISVSATTQIADRLERALLVERVACQEDRRLKHLQLSSHGKEMMRSRRERRIERALRSLRQMSAQDREEAMHSLHVLMSVVEALPAQE